MRENNKKRMAKAGISGLLIAGLLTGSVEYASHTYLYDNHVAAKAAAGNQTVEEQITPYSAAKKSTEVTKEETVYATLGADGSVNDVIVSDWLKNSGSADGVTDYSILQDIVNMKGDEKFTQNGEELSWDTSDQDIYYQGKTDAEMPVGMKITYELDGKEMKPEELAGKSGKLTMRIQYTNKAKQKITADGEKTTIYTPFLMATGMILPVEKFSNITIDNGSVVSEGDNDIVVAYGMPGLSESLGLEDLDLGEVDLDTKKITDKLTDSVTITADVKDFSMGTTYTVATSELFGKVDAEEIEDAGDLEEKLDEITDAAEKLVDGSDTLQDGLATLDDKFDDYADAIGTVNKGVKSLNSGARKLKKGTNVYTKGTDKLLKGVGTYVDGSKKLSKGIKSYTSGAGKISDALGKMNSSTANFPKQYNAFSSGINTFVNSVVKLLSEENMKQLTDGTSSLKKGVKQVDDGVKAVQSGVGTVNSTVKKLQKTEELDQCVAGLKQMKQQYTGLAESASDAATKKQYTQMAAALEGAIQYIEGGEQVAAGLDAATNGKADGEADGNGAADLALALAQIQAATDVESSETNLYTGAAALEESAKTMSEYAGQLRASAATLLTADKAIKEGISTISTSIKQLNTAGKQLKSNNKTLTDGANSIIKNSATIKKNSKKITSNSASLRRATKQLEKGTKSLTAGLKKLVVKTGDVSKALGKLSGGAEELSEGMSTFQEEAVEKLTGTVTDVMDGLGGFEDRLSGVTDASKDYQSFSGLAKGMNGSVKFVMSTEEIK